MKNFSKEIVSLIENSIPELKNKVQPGVVDSNAATPYAAYGEPSIKPIRTKEGITGMQTELEVAVFHKTKTEAEKLNYRLAYELDKQLIGSQRMFYSSSEYSYISDDGIKIHSFLLTFKIR